MMAWAHGRGMGLTLIEGMPLGEVGIDRVDSYLPLRELHDLLARRYTLSKLDKRTGGPARYVHVAETGGVLGFITPMSHNFCESCNRVRLTATGQLFLTRSICATHCAMAACRRWTPRSTTPC
jgi:cyclic pyranopterin phosphate synthase